MKITTPLENAVETIVRVAKPDKIILFGSSVAGKQKEGSDLDLLVLKKNLKNQRRLVQSIYLNFGSIGAPVDVLALDSERFEILKGDPDLIYHDAYKNGKVVYERPLKNKRLAEKGKK